MALRGVSGGHFKMVRRAVHVSSENSVTYFKLSFNLKTLSNPIFSAESKKGGMATGGPIILQS